MIKPFLFVAFLVFLFAPPIFSKKGEAKLGLVYDATDFTDIQAAVAAELAVEEINKSSKILKGINIELVIRDAQSRADANNFVLEIAKDNSYFGTLGPTFSSYSEIAGVTGADFKFITISGSATSAELSDKTVYRYFMRTIADDDQQVKALGDFILESEWNDVIIFATTGGFSVNLAENFAKYASENDIDIPLTVFFNEGDIDLETEFSQIRRTGARILITFAQLTDFRNIMEVASNEDFTGIPYQYVGVDASSSSGFYFNDDGKVNDTLKDAVYGTVVTLPRAGPLKNDKLFKDFEKNFEKRAEEPGISSYSTFTYDAVYTIARGLDQVLDGETDVEKFMADEENREALLNACLSQEFEGASGSIAFDANGDRLNGAYALQNYQNEEGKSKEILAETGTWEPPKVKKGKDKRQDEEDFSGAPLGTWNGLEDIIYRGGETERPDSEPRKTVNYYSCEENEDFTDIRGVTELDLADDDPELLDDERHCDQVVDCDNWNDEGFDCSPSLAIAYIIIGALNALLMVIVFLSILFIIKNKGRGRVRASGLAFAVVACTGTLIGLSTVYFFFGKAITALCIIRWWLLSIGSGLLIGSLWAKQFRVWRVFGNTKLKRTVVTEQTMLLITALLLVPDLIVLALWTGVDTPTAELDDDDEHVICQSSLIWLWISLLGVWKIILLIMSSAFSFLTRTFPSAFSESRLIAFAIYNATLTCIIVVPIIIAVGGDEFLQWLLIEIIIMFFFFSTFALMVLPKIWGILITDRNLSEKEKNALPQLEFAGPGGGGSRISSMATGGSQVDL